MAPERAGSSPVKRYAVSLSFAAGAILIAMALRPRFGGQTPLTPFTVAVILSAAYGGAGPGLLVTAIGGLFAYLLFGGTVVSLFPTGQPGLSLFFVVGFIITAVIEWFRRSNQKLESAKASLESANRELSRRSEALTHSNDELQRFAYALSHDLQNPLRTISMFTERLAMRKNSNEEEATALRFIGEGVESMQTMIRGLLEYATASHMEEQRGVADVNTVIRTVLQDLHSQIEESGAQVGCETLPTVDGDETRIRQLFQNLVSNAIKYRGECRPEIAISARPGKREWTFCVRDNGIGIDMRHSEKIFGLFARLHASSTYKGTGIGLAVCRAIVEGHGGRIWVESEPGKGSSFLFTLPSRVSK